MIKVVSTADRAQWERAYQLQRAWLWSGRGVRGYSFLPAPVPLPPVCLTARPLLSLTDWFRLLDTVLGYRGYYWIDHLQRTGGTAVLLINARYSDGLGGLQAYVDRWS